LTLPWLPDPKRGGFRPSAAPLFAAIGLVALAACQPAPLVLLGPEASDLGPTLERALASQPGGARVGIQEGRAPIGNFLRLSSAPDWVLPAGSPPLRAFPAGWDRDLGFRFPEAFAALARLPDGSWSCIPLLFDVWGVTTFSAGAPPLPPFRDFIGKAAPGSLAFAGSRPSARQVLYLFGLSPDEARVGDATVFFRQVSSGLRPFPALAARAWVANSWDFAPGDLVSIYHEGSKLSFLETYRDYSAWNVGGARAFRPLSSGPIDAPGSGLAGPVLFLEYRGDERGRAAAVRLARALVESAFVREAGRSGHWLAVDQRAPELDAAGEMIRRLVAGSATFHPVTDRLPDPPTENSLLSRIQLAVDRAPRP